MHSDWPAWEKIAEVLLDYTHWLARLAPNQATVAHYDAVERQIERDRRRGTQRRSARRG